MGIMRRARSGLYVVCFAGLWPIMGANAQSSFPYTVRAVDTPEEPIKRSIVLPYALATEQLGTVVGLAGGSTQPVKEPGLLFASGYYSSNESWLLLGGFSGLYMERWDRFFLDSVNYVSRGTERRLYLGGDPAYPGERSGSNDSSPENFTVQDAYEGRAYLTLRVVTPLGEGKEQPMHHYLMDEGLLRSQPSGGPWNPLENGRTVFSIRPEFREQFVDLPEEDAVFQTMNITFAAEYDNRNYRPNPTSGSYQRIAVTRDWGWLDDTDPWTVLEAEASLFQSLGSAPWAKHQVLALDAATMNTPSWKEDAALDSRGGGGRPPYFAGANLGGLMRMRAFPDNRFHDKAMIYYSAEYRMIPTFDPLPFITQIRALNIQWWQFVVFGEVGRVASDWDLKTLHTDMKNDFGVGLRAMLGSGVVRLDVAFSEESTTVAAMFGHAY